MNSNSGMEARKLSIVEHLADLQDESILLQIENLIKPNVDFWDELSEQEKELIKKGIQDHEEGKRISYEKLMSKWRKNK